MEPIIRVENLTHTYSAGTPFERSAVKGLHMDVMRGEFLGIIGHTGSGKSTLISHLNGLLKPTSGRVLLDGEDRPIGDTFCYRDRRTQTTIPAVHSILPFTELYERTGIAHASF